MTADILLELDATDWAGPFDADARARAIAALESGQVVVLPHLPFTLLNSETRFLDAASLDNSRKNISYDPKTGRCHGTSTTDHDALAAMLRRYGDAAEVLVRSLYPTYQPHLERARTSFRPAEISGRPTTPRHDDTRLHVDAFPTRPTAGRRILRVFNNVAPDGTPRRWRVGEPFADFARAYLPRTKRLLPGQAWAMQTLGLTKGRRTPYDQAMLGLHDTGKLDTNYQANCPQTHVQFPPGTTWMCFTDQVLHAAMSGRCAFEQTFHLPHTAMAQPSQTPIAILERLTGHAMA